MAERDASFRMLPTDVPKATSAPSASSEWETVLFNCYCHFFEEVVPQIVKALGCTEQKARILATVAHINGRSIIYRGTEEECLRVAQILQEIGLLAIYNGPELKKRPDLTHERTQPDERNPVFR